MFFFVSILDAFLAACLLRRDICFFLRVADNFILIGILVKRLITYLMLTVLLAPFVLLPSYQVQYALCGKRYRSSRNLQLFKTRPVESLSDAGGVRRVKKKKHCCALDQSSFAGIAGRSRSAVFSFLFIYFCSLQCHLAKSTTKSHLRHLETPLRDIWETP